MVNDTLHNLTQRREGAKGFLLSDSASLRQNLGVCNECLTITVLPLILTISCRSILGRGKVSRPFIEYVMHKHGPMRKSYEC